MQLLRQLKQKQLLKKLPLKMLKIKRESLHLMALVTG
jgi:hypothetical protein